MAKATLSTLMTKIGYVFRLDSFVVDCNYIIGGETSEKDNPSNILLVLSPDYINMLREELPTTFEDYKEDSVLEFLDVKNAKKELYSNTRFLNNKEAKDIRELVDYDKKIIDKVNDWDTFNYNLDEIENFVTNGQKITLFSDNDKIPEVTISKKVIPMLSLKNFNELYYKPLPAKDDNSLNQLVLRLDTEWFQIYSIIEYLDV